MKVIRRRTNNQLEHITQEMYKQNLELVERNKTLTLLRQIDEVVLGPVTDVHKAVQMIADILVKDSDFNLAMLYVDSEKDKRVLSLYGLAASSPGAKTVKQYISKEIAELHLRESALKPLSKIITDKKITPVTSLAILGLEELPKELAELQNSLECKTLFVCPLNASNGFIGVLVLGLPVETVSEYQRNLLDRLTGTVSIAVQNHVLDAELQAASAQLKKQNRRLKELDKSKDEFISMASHQLRTPLTSIKGYLSMILEGDVGPVTKSEKEYVKRAFDSAQKMVYLIADLLNVSRLQTGKFVIENQPTNLAEVVSQELEQLTEQIEAKNIKLTYQKPAHFPLLNLDETKVRQVIMNFLDNALYYTPKGGRVTIDVKATDESVSYSVTDTGIGVPKELQHHLFNKFYRADNARKVRPDGTGLGLFMAKKVIVAEGGAIIFNSVEGKGSTFGFSFPRKQLEAVAEAPKAPDDKQATTDVKSEKPAEEKMANPKPVEAALK